MRLAEVVLEKARSIPEQTALVFRDAKVDYNALSMAISRCAAGLKELGICRGDRLAILLPNCPPFVISYFAATLIDAAAVPANPLLKAGELAYIWTDSDVKAVVTIPQLLHVVEQAVRDAPSIKSVISTGSKEEATSLTSTELPGHITFDELLQMGAAALARNPELLSSDEVDENECAVIIYTSGTTGRPKGAMLSHKNLNANVRQARAALYIAQTDVFVTVLPLFHSFSGTVCMNIPLMTGCCVVLMESFAPARILEAFETNGVTIFAGVPAMYHALLQFVPERKYDHSSLRMTISGGAPLPVGSISAIEAHFGVPILEGDGPTECSPATSVNPFLGIRKPGSVGIPLPGVEIAIFDDNDGPMPANEIGEIVVRGDNVMLGYLNQPEATAEAMTSGWYHTGDLGKIDNDGYVFIVDRKKDMIITAGLNVYPREVEEVLLTHEAVADCAVIGLSDSARGEEVTAIVVLKPGRHATNRELAGYCRERLANYKAPRKVLFRETLPRGATGKVVKRLLKKELEMESPAEGLTQD